MVMIMAPNRKYTATSPAGLSECSLDDLSRVEACWDGAACSEWSVSSQADTRGQPEQNQGRPPLLNPHALIDQTVKPESSDRFLA
jgi:hypothetical protein